MVQILHSELDMMCRDRVIVKIYLSAPIPDSRFIIGLIAVPGDLVVCMYLILGECTDVKLIVIESDCGIAEQLVVKDVVPYFVIKWALPLYALRNRRLRSENLWLILALTSKK